MPTLAPAQTPHSISTAAKTMFSTPTVLGMPGFGSIGGMKGMPELLPSGGNVAIPTSPNIGWPAHAGCDKRT